MIRRFILLLMTVICSLSMFGQVTISQEDYNNLPQEVKVQLKKSNISKELKEYSEYASIGKEIGIAVNETLKAVEDSAIRISETSIGKTAVFILVWNFLYKDILGVVIGGILLIISICLIFDTLKFLKETRKDSSSNDNDDARFFLSLLVFGILFTASMVIIF